MIDYKKKIQENMRPFHSINIIPFTDIVLVLLIVFMISAPSLLYSTLGVDLPAVKNQSESPPKALHLVINSNGTILIDSQAVKKENLEILLKSKRDEKKNLIIHLDADTNTSHGKVTEILDTLRTLGIKEIYVGTQKK